MASKSAGPKVYEFHSTTANRLRDQMVEFLIKEGLLINGVTGKDIADLMPYEDDPDLESEARERIEAIKLSNAVDRKTIAESIMARTLPPIPEAPHTTTMGVQTDTPVIDPPPVAYETEEIDHDKIFWDRVAEEQDAGTIPTWDKKVKKPKKNVPVKEAILGDSIRQKKERNLGWMEEHETQIFHTYKGHTAECRYSGDLTTEPENTSAGCGKGWKASPTFAWKFEHDGEEWNSPTTGTGQSLSAFCRDHVLWMIASGLIDTGSTSWNGWDVCRTEGKKKGDWSAP